MNETLQIIFITHRLRDMVWRVVAFYLIFFALPIFVMVSMVFLFNRSGYDLPDSSSLFGVIYNGIMNYFPIVFPVGYIFGLITHKQTLKKAKSPL